MKKILKIALFTIGFVSVQVFCMDKTKSSPSAKEIVQKDQNTLAYYKSRTENQNRDVLFGFYLTKYRNLFFIQRNKNIDPQYKGHLINTIACCDEQIQFLKLILGDKKSANEKEFALLTLGLICKSARIN
jgi:hypothetical protein